MHHIDKRAVLLVKVAHMFAIGGYETRSRSERGILNFESYIESSIPFERLAVVVALEDFCCLFKVTEHCFKVGDSVALLHFLQLSVDLDSLELFVFVFNLLASL
jgi:hypothetical protein